MRQSASSAGGGNCGEERSLECRRFEVAGTAVEIRQDLRGSNALRPLDDDRVAGAGSGGGQEDGEAAPLILTPEDLSRVGLVVWQAGFVLADWLLRRPPFGSWHGLSVLDIGCGTGLLGILLALAGAEVTLSDQPHILPPAESNAKANLTPGLHRCRTVAYTWGCGDAAAALLSPAAIPAGTDSPPASVPTAGGGSYAAEAAALEPAVGGPTSPPPPMERLAQASSAAAAAASPPPLPPPYFDVIVAADVVYQPECYADLAATLCALAAPHTLLFLAFKRRGLQEDSFLGLLEAAGLAVQEVPASQLAPEYQTGSYRVLRACRIE